MSQAQRSVVRPGKHPANEGAGYVGTEDMIPSLT